MKDIYRYNNERYPLYYASLCLTSNSGTNITLTMQSFDSACTIDKMGTRLKAGR